MVTVVAMCHALMDGRKSNAIYNLGLIHVSKSYIYKIAHAQQK